ncbi:MAG: hypothetical protein H6668_18370 [Ardenticatenaceae bacterium]|nr:hypothetical protein [Ardenticatenaceae bacterium]
MPSSLALLLIFTAATLPGWLIVRRFPNFDGDFLEQLMASLIVGITLTGTLALLLAQFGLFSLPVLTILWLLLTTAFWLTAPRTPHPTPHTPPPNLQSPISNPQSLLLLLWLPLALYLFLRPHEFILGAADAGVYINLGAEIAQNGGLIIEDDFLAALPESLQTAVFRPINNAAATAYYLPAFYLTGPAQPGHITPQFYPTHPVWLAIAYSLGGVWAELMLPGVWALLGAVAVYLTVRQFAGWQTAVLALAGLTLNALQIWFARYPVSETFAQFLLWAGLWGVGGWLAGRRDNRLWGLLGGLALGQSFLLRIDAVFMLPVLVLLWLWLWANGRSWRNYLWFFLPLVAQIGYSFLHGAWQSAPYFYELFGFGLLLLQIYWQIPLLGGLLGIGILLILSRYRHHVGQLAQWERPLRLVLVALILLATVYLWFIRPAAGSVFIFDDPYSQSQVPWYDHENLRRIGWYLSPLGVWLGALGVALMVWRVERKTAVLLAICLLFSALYLWNIRSNPHQIYTMRRYLAATMPLLVVGTAILLGWLAQQQGKLGLALAAVLTLAWLGGLGWSARGFISQVDLAGLIPQMDSLAAQFPADAVIIFNEQNPIGPGDTLGTPLRFLYQRDVIKLRDWAAVDEVALREAMLGWLENGRSVVWIGDPAWLQAQGFTPTLSTLDITTASLETVYDHKPQQVLPQEWHLPLAILK